MKTNVFLRSARRQPVRALCLALVVVFVTFAFVGRVSEYLLIRQETERLEGYYRSVASLEALNGNLWADTAEAVAYLEGNTAVAAINTYDYLSGVMEGDICNADIDLLSSERTQYLAFYGTALLDGTSTFRVNKVLAGLPEYIKQDGTASVTYDANTSGFVQENTVPLKAGQCYLVLGWYNPFSGSCSAGWSEGTFATSALLKPVRSDVWYYPVEEEADWSDPALKFAEDFIRQARDEQRALNIIPLQDMGALPMVQETDPAIYLTAGRWLDGEDDTQGRKTCVINNNLATTRKLEVGDTITITLRDVPTYFGYFYDSSTLTKSAKTETGEYEIVGIYDYRDHYKSTITRNFTYIPASAVPENFWKAGQDTLSTVRFLSEMERIVPRGITPLPYPGTVSFVLTSPEEETRFVAETRADLERMGFRASFLENGLQEFQAMSRPMRQSSLYNALIYSAILLAAFSLAAFVYFFLRRRELAIVRALGVPVKSTVGQISLPLLLIGLPGVLVGGAMGWQYTLKNAAETLEALAAFGSGNISALPIGWLALLWVAAAALLLALTVGSAAALAKRPVLEQMQGGSNVKAKRRTARQDAIAASGTAVRVSELSFDAAALAQPLPRTRSTGTACTLRFVWRHMSRARVKSLLAVTLAAGFTIGLGAIRLSIAANRQEVDRLYETTSVSIELTKADSTQTTTSGAFLFDDTVQTIFDTGFITSSYLEGANHCRVFLYDEPWEKGQILSIKVANQTNRTIRSIDDAEAFLTVGSGTDASITYLDGWDAGLFAEDWAARSAQAPDSDPILFPIVLPKETYDEYGLQPGDVLGMACKTAFQVCQVAGYYEGGIAGEYHNGPSVTVHYDESSPILMPTSALRSMVRHMLYSKAIFTVDPARNRDLDAFRAEVDALANTPRISGVPTRTILRDEELRLAIEPIENSIRLMELLYPVALVLSLLAAAGVSVLFVMLSAKEAAILRIQGTTKLHTVLMLTLQQVFTCAAGLTIGLVGILAWIGGTRPDILPGIAPGAAVCAVLYLAAGVAGAVVASVLTTVRNPLEMLQVKE